jgi:RNA polymerase sigma factor (sigma-70 family)
VAVVAPRIAFAASGAAPSSSRTRPELDPVLSRLLESGAALPTPTPGEGLDAFRDRVDTALMALWRDTRDEAAFDALYSHARERVLVWLRWLARGEPVRVDPSELLQDTFVNVYRYGAAFRDDSSVSFRVWVRTIAGNVLRRATTRGRLRRRGEVSLEDLTQGPGEPAARSVAPHGRWVEAEERRALCESWSIFLAHYARAYAGLSPRDRCALHLVEVDGLSYGEASLRLAVSSSNMKMIMLRARRRLLSAMRRGMVDEGAGQASERAKRPLAALG